MESGGIPLEADWVEDGVDPQCQPRSAFVKRVFKNCIHCFCKSTSGYTVAIMVLIVLVGQAKKIGGPAIKSCIQPPQVGC